MQIALLKTLALVASELPSVPDATLQQCMSIAERLAGAYSTLWPKQRSTIDAAFIGMLKALSAKQAISAYICLLALCLRPWKEYVLSVLQNTSDPSVCSL